MSRRALPNADTVHDRGFYIGNKRLDAGDLTG